MQLKNRLKSDRITVYCRCDEIGNHASLKMMWAQALVGSSPTSGTMSYYRTLPISNDANLKAYVIGLAIGDGNLSNPNGRATKLRISCDTKYPLLIKRVATSLQELLPENKVNTIQKKGNCIDVYVCSNHLENLLGWKAKGGSKDLQKVSVPTWIQEKEEYKINCLRGLIETDGAIYLDRGYRMVIFSSIIPNLAEDVYNLINSLGFKSHLYKVPEKKSTHGYKYQVRLSKDVQKFLDIVQPDKS